MATNSTEGFPEFDFSETLDAIIEPLLNTCELSVAKLSKMDQDIYMVNCLYHIQTAMMPYDFTRQKRDSISARMNDLLDDMAQEEYSKLMEQAGLTQIKDTLATKPAEVGFKQKHPMKKMYSYLAVDTTVDTTSHGC